jgi:tetratricopeptide (TPR) repeat protein
MIFKEARCPNCGGELQLPEDKATVKCMYCGGDIIVQEAIHTAEESNVPNWLILAKAAIDGRNYQEAFNYYTKVLEVDPQNYEAWFGKGEAAGWLSTLADFRLSEMLADIENAIKNAPEEIRENLISRSADCINSITIAYYQLAREHLLKFIALENTYKNYIDQCNILLQILEYAHNLSPKDRKIMENIILICTDLIKEVKYVDPYHSDVWGNPHRYMTAFVAEELAENLKTKINQFVNKIQEIDSSYQPPQIIKDKKRCFVATVTMGDVNHPIVALLREFRDTWLLQRYMGRIFIRYYYIFGPYLAKFIERSILLKRLSYILVIRPFVSFARCLLKNSH